MRENHKLKQYDPEDPTNVLSISKTFVPIADVPVVENLKENLKLGEALARLNAFQKTMVTNEKTKLNKFNQESAAIDKEEIATMRAERKKSQ